MRAENDHVLGNSVGGCKDESKPNQCPEEKWEDAVLKSNENVCELFYDTRSGDDWDKESDVGKVLERRSFGDSDEAGKKTRETGHDSVEKVDPVFFMDKNVTVCDLPEIVVCYKENTYHVVKDICVDEGVPVQEKFLFGDKDSVKCSSNSHQCGSEDLSKAENPFETVSSEDGNSKVDGSVICNDHNTDRDVETSTREDEGTSNCDQEVLVVTEEAKDSPTQALNPFEENSKDEVGVSEEKSVKEMLTLGDILIREDEQNCNRPEELSQEKEKRSLEAKGLETELEKTEEPEKAEGRLSFVSTTTSQEPRNETCDDPEKPKTENQQLDSHEDGKLLSNGFGETSFSASEPVSISGHITYSGPIAFSGSLSVRSDASTTSGRSFAFPILQSEYYSSPVRMAKADKRRQKGWRHSLLCCRFS